MKRTRILFLFLMFVSVAMVGGCSNPADDAAPATVEEPEAISAETEAALPPGTVYTIGEGSTVGFTGSKITGSHDGGFNSFTGEIILVDGDPAASRVAFTIDTTSLWADAEKLTGHLKSPDFFDVETYPTAKFISTAIVAAEPGYEVTGNLVLHGITKQITFPAAIEVAEGVVKATAEFFVMRFDFKIEYPGRPDDLIRDEVVIRLDINAREQAGI